MRLSGDAIYEDANRRVVVKRDVNQVGDGALMSVTSYDQLGRIRLTRQLESASQNRDDDAAGIKVQTRYRYAAGARYQLQSNPYRASTSSGASGELTMGWKLSRYDQDGRIRSEQTFAGASLPSPWGSNGVGTGSTTTSYAAETVAVTDPASKSRQYTYDALGRLTNVIEDPNGN
jgi:YD repeat-containing protein